MVKAAEQWEFTQNILAPNEHLIFPNSHSIFLENLGVFSCCSEYSMVRVSTNLLSFSYLFPTMPKMLEGRWCTDPKIYYFCLLSFHLKFIRQFFLNPSPPKVWTAKQFKVQESLKQGKKYIVQGRDKKGTSSELMMVNRKHQFLFYWYKDLDYCFPQSCVHAEFARVDFLADEKAVKWIPPKWLCHTSSPISFIFWGKIA